MKKLFSSFRKKNKGEKADKGKEKGEMKKGSEITTNLNTSVIETTQFRQIETRRVTVNGVVTEHTIREITNSGSSLNKLPAISNTSNSILKFPESSISNIHNDGALIKPPVNLNYKSPYRQPNTTQTSGSRPYSNSPIASNAASLKSKFLNSSYPSSPTKITTPSPRAVPNTKNFFFTPNTGGNVPPVKNVNAERNTSLTNPYLNKSNDSRPVALRTENHFSRPALTTRNSLDDLSKAIQIKVKRNNKFYDSDNKVPTYSTHGRKRGSLLIINNIKFDKNEKASRKGAELDEHNIRKLFKDMGFIIESYRNLKRPQFLDNIKSYTKKSILKSVDINVVVIMSHGLGNKDGVTQILSSDNQLIPSSDIIQAFDNVHCTYLRNKPKIFIFQCCRGDDTQELQHDAVPFQVGVQKVLCDMLLAYSTIPGYVSHRDPALGTWYIQAICKVFMENACDTHVEDLLKIVDEMLTDLSNKTGSAQTSSYENRGFKRCYLHP